MHKFKSPVLLYLSLRDPGNVQNAPFIFIVIIYINIFVPIKIKNTDDNYIFSYNLFNNPVFIVCLLNKVCCSLNIQWNPDFSNS